MSKTPEKWFDRWPGYFGSKIGSCDVLVVHNDGTQQFYPSNGCHGIMYNVSGASIDYVYSSLWCRHEHLFEAAKEYWGYLLDPDKSPFRKALPNLKMVYGSQGRPLAFGIKNQGVPNQYCVPLMMQTRVPQENTNKLASFKLFREHGFDLVESFFLSEHFYYVDGTIYKVNSTYEHAFAPKDGINFDLLKNGTPNNINTFFTWKNNQHQYVPVTSMWSTGKHSKVWTMTHEERPYTGVLPHLFKKNVSSKMLFPSADAHSFTPDYIIEKLKANRTGW